MARISRSFDFVQAQTHGERPLTEAQTVIGLRQDTGNRARPHPLPGYRPPAPASVPDLAFRRSRPGELAVPACPDQSAG